MRITVALFVLFISACKQPKEHYVYKQTAPITTGDTTNRQLTVFDVNTVKINTGATTPRQLLDYAQTLIGIPYLYGSTDPAKGFDCSGFITYVFNHFNIVVPRSSAGFTNIEKEIDLIAAKPGDIILFTGTDTADNQVGHMGIITSAGSDSTLFIHSTSGKANGVTITPLNQYYMARFVKVIRVFSE